MVNWLLFYVLGCVPAVLAVALIAAHRRKSHGMGPGAAVQLTLSAGLVWPLLVVAAVQIVLFLMLSKVLGSVRALGGHDVEPAHEPVTEPAPAGMEVAKAAA